MLTINLQERLRLKEDDLSIKPVGFVGVYICTIVITPFYDDASQILKIISRILTVIQSVLVISSAVELFDDVLSLSGGAVIIDGYGDNGFGVIIFTVISGIFWFVPSASCHQRKPLSLAVLALMPL